MIHIFLFNLNTSCEEPTSDILISAIYLYRYLNKKITEKMSLANKFSGYSSLLAFYQYQLHPLNKKVLLRERKRHTARRIASTCYAVPVGGTPPSWDLTWIGGYPLPREVPPSQVGYPHLDLEKGTPCLDLGRGYPHLDLTRGYPPPPPGPGKGYPPSVDGLHPPPPPSRCERADACENITFPILRIRAVINK